MVTHTHHKVVDLAVMKAEIENIKTHFATKADIMRWTVAVGIATIMSIYGIVNEFRKEIRQEMQQHTATLSAKIDKLVQK